MSPNPGGGPPEPLIEQLARLKQPEHPDTERLLGMIVALAGEVFVLKAKVECQAQALAAAGLLTPAALQATGASTALKDWIAAEEKAFGKHLLRPFVEPDVAVDTTHFLRER